MSASAIHTGELPVRGGRMPVLGIVLLALLASVACTPQQSTATVTEPTPTTSEASPATPLRSTTTPSTESEFDGTASLFGDLPPGRYRTEGFEPVNFTFEVQESREGERGWGGGFPPEEVAEAFGGDPEQLTGKTRWAISAEAAPQLPVFEFVRRWDFEQMRTSWGISFLKQSFSGSIDDLLEGLRGVEGLEIQGEPSSASLGGESGMYVEGVVGSEEASPFTGISHLPGKMIRYYVLNVEGGTKVVAVKAPAEDFDRFLPEAEEFLSTVHFAND